MNRAVEATTRAALPEAGAPEDRPDLLPYDGRVSARTETFEAIHRLPMKPAAALFFSPASAGRVLISMLKILTM
jgi:hypothetical protein